MAYITNKTANHEDPTLDDAKVKGILTGKSYIKTANNTSFTTVKGEYEIPYSELYIGSNKTLTTPGNLSTEWEIVLDFGATGLSIGDIVQPTITGTIQPSIAKIENYVRTPQFTRLMRLLYPLRYTLKVVSLKKK